MTDELSLLLGSLAEYPQLKNVTWKAELICQKLQKPFLVQSVKMSLSKASKDVYRGINRKNLLTDLWDRGVRPLDKDFEELVKHRLYLLLDLREATCSSATNKSIAAEAAKFRTRVRDIWKRQTKKDVLFSKPYFLDDIVINIVPIVQENPELAPSTSGGSVPGPRKPFEELKARAKSYRAADVRAAHEPGAILQAAPKAASQLGLGQTASAIRLMQEDPVVNPGLALDGMKNESKQFHTSICNVIHLQSEICK